MQKNKFQFKRKKLAVIRLKGSGYACRYQRGPFFDGKKSLIGRVIAAAVLLVMVFSNAQFLGLVKISKAATVVWDGGGGDANWTTGANWSTNSVPTPSDIAQFDGTCISNCSATINTSTSISGLNLAAGYASTVTQSNGFTLAIGSSNFAVASGTFVGGNSNITVTDGSYLQTGGITTSTSATLTVQRNFSVTGGTFNHNNGTVAFTDDNSFDDTTVTCGASTFNLVTVTKDQSPGGDMIISSGCTVPLGASPTSAFNGTSTNGGTITIASGTWTITSDGTLTNNGTITHSGTGWDSNGSLVMGSSGVVNYPSGTTASFGNNLDVSQGTFPSGLTVTFTDTSTGDNTTLTCGSVTFTKITITKDSGGNMIISSGCTVPLGASPTSAFNGPRTFTNNGTTTIDSGTWTISSGPTFTNNGTITHNGSGWVAGGNFTNGASGVVTYAGSTMSLSKDLNVASGTFPSGLTVTFTDADGNDNSTLTCGSVTFTKIIITKDSGGDMAISSGCTAPLGASPTSTFSGSLATFTNNGTTTVDSGTWTIVDTNTSGFHTLTNNGTITHNGSGWVTGGGFVNGSAGVVTYASSTMTVNGTFNVASGTFPSGLTLTLGDDPQAGSSGDNSVLTCGSVTFTKVIITKNSGGVATSGGSLNIGSSCTIPLGASPTTVSNNPATWTNNGVITVDSGTWTHTDTNTSNGAGFGNKLTNNGTITHNGSGWDWGIGLANGSSGVVTYSTGTTASFAGPLDVSQGTFPSGKLITFTDNNAADDTTLTCGSVTFGGLTIVKDASGPGDMILGSSCTDTGNLTFTAGTLSNPSSAYTLIVQGDVALNSSGTFGGANLTLSLEGSGSSTIATSTSASFASKLKVNKSVGSTTTLASSLTIGNTFEIASGAFDQGATFNFKTGGAATISSSGTWYNTGTGDITLSGDVTNGGTVTLDGSGVGCGGTDAIVITSSVGGTQRNWSGSFTVYDVNASDQTGSVTAISSTNTSNNTWTFVSACNSDPSTPSSLGPSNLVDGSWTTDNTPTLTFTLSDPDGSDTVKYNILVDDSSNFASPVVNYLSALQAQGSTSFTVGQAAGSGSYSVGSSGQTLSDSSGYYWRVSAIDNTGAASATTTANSGSIAFKVDATAPAAGTVSLGSITTGSITATVSGASDATSGLSATPYTFYNSTRGTNSGAQSSSSWTETGLNSNTSYTYYVVTADTAGNTAASPSVSASTLSSGGGGSPVTDPFPPPSGGFKLIINNNDSLTTSSSVTLTLDGGSAATMAISNSQDFTNVPKIPYQTTLPWNLCQGLSSCPSNTYTVYGIFYNQNNVASPMVSDSIQYLEPSVIAPPEPNPEPDATTTNPQIPLGVDLTASLDKEAWFKILSGVAINQPVNFKAIISGNFSQGLTYNVDCTGNGGENQFYQSQSTVLTLINVCSYPKRGTYTATLTAAQGSNSKSDSVIIEVDVPAGQSLPPSNGSENPPAFKQQTPPETGGEQAPRGDGGALPSYSPPANSGNNQTENETFPVFAQFSSGFKAVLDTIVSTITNGAEQVGEGIGNIISGTGEGIGNGANNLAQATKKSAQALREIFNLVAENEASIKVAAGASTVVVAPTLLTMQYSLAANGLIFQIKSFTDLWLMLLGLIQGFLTSIGLRKQRRRWGTVYDSVTKQPLDPAIVELIEVKTGKIVEKSITDLTGRFGFLTKPGQYTLKAQKSHYTFPSKLVTERVDSIFNNLYHGEVLKITNTSDVLSPNIPMDQAEFDWNQQEKQKILKFHPKLEAFIAGVLSFLFWFGLIFVILTFFVHPTILNGIFIVVYLLLSVLRKFIPHLKLWGRVSSNKIATKELLLEISPKNMPDVTLGKALTNKEGKFFLKAPPGAYILRVRQTTGPTMQVLKETDITIGKEGVLNKEISLE